MKLSAGNLKPTWTPPRLQAPPSAKQVYAFAFQTYTPGITDHDWSEEIKGAIARGKFEATRADTITLAIRTVSKRIGRQDAGLVQRPVHTPDPPAPRLTNEEVKSILKGIEDRYHAIRQGVR
jgi:hypothetical protein